jgi:hypothetical protein
VSESVFQDCEFNSIVPHGKETAVFDPNAFSFVLKAAGFTVQDSKPSIQAVDTATYKSDYEFTMIVKLVRCFATRTHITDILIKTKFGKQSAFVLERLIPRLIHVGVLYEDTALVFFRTSQNKLATKHSVLNNWA